jgi:hypothetical protein
MLGNCNRRGIFGKRVFGVWGLGSSMSVTLRVVGFTIMESVIVMGPVSRQPWSGDHADVRPLLIDRFGFIFSVRVVA